MKKTFALAAACVALWTHATFAQSAPPNLTVFHDVSDAVNHYAMFTIFDDVNAEVQNGVVTLTGKVTMPYKKDEIAKRVSKVAGVTRVVDKITVLPVSGFDDQIRYRVARAIYGNSAFWPLASMPNPPIHIVVDHGRVTLTGVVQSDVDRMLARSLATGLGELSVKSELKTPSEVRDQLEKL
jgi:osmotically-inducible protein OsmY